MKCQIKAQSAAERTLILTALVAAGHRIHHEGLSVAKFDREYPFARYPVIYFDPNNPKVNVIGGLFTLSPDRKTVTLDDIARLISPPVPVRGTRSTSTNFALVHTLDDKPVAVEIKIAEEPRKCSDHWHVNIPIERARELAMAIGRIPDKYAS